MPRLLPTVRQRSTRPRHALPTATVLAAALALPATSGAQGAGAPVTLHGVVFDSLARAPLTGAMVQVVRADNPANARTTASDSTGGFQLDSLAPGRYLLGFLHPTLDLLGVQLAPVVVVADGRPLPPVTLAIPGPTSVRTAVCPPGSPGDSTGAIAGAVRDAVTGDPAPGATIVLSWVELNVGRQGVQRETRRVPTTVRPDGGFLICGVPTDGPLQASASTATATSGIVELAPPARGLVVQRFAIGPIATASGGAATSDDSAAADERGGTPRPAAGTARLAGRVIGPNGQPVSGANVHVLGTATRAQTGADGRYVLGALPAGTFSLEVRAVGLEPARRPVDLANGQTVELGVTLSKALPQLDRVSVIARSPERARLLSEFENRRRSMQGRFVTADDIAQRHATELTDVLRGVATLNVVPRGARGNVLRGRRNCVPTVWLDGNLIRGGADQIDDLVTPQNVQGIEIYGGSSIVPAQFNVTGTGGSLTGGPVSCGAIVIWTAR